MKKINQTIGGAILAIVVVAGLIFTKQQNEPSSYRQTLTTVSTVANVTTEAELRAAFASALTGNIKKINFLNNITLTKTIDFSQTLNNPSSSLTVDLQNNRLTIIADTGLKRMYTSFTTAEQKIDFQIRIENGEFFTTNPKCIIIYSAATYQGHVINCKFNGGLKQLDLHFALNFTIQENRFDNYKYCAIVLDIAPETGQGNNMSQSNHTLLMQNNFRASAGNFAAVYSRGNSGLYDFHNIYEGTDGGSDYASYLTCNGSQTVKNYTVIGTHVEFKPKKSCFYAQLSSGGVARFDDVYSQKDATLITAASNAYARIIVSNTPYITNLTTFENVGACRWYFLNTPSECNVESAARWSTTKPDAKNISSIWGIDPDGQYPFINLAGRKL